MSTIATIISEENEETIYCKITDFSGLDKAVQVLTQEQYEIKSFDKGKIRVRAETTGDQTNYTLTTKVKGSNKSIASNTEYTISIDREYFDAFKAIADKGQLKKRYLFPIEKVTTDGIPINISNEEICFEVDVFTNPKGDRYAWCKIDLELDGILAMSDKGTKVTTDKVKIIAKITDLPFKPVEFFTINTATDDQKLFVGVLYKLWETK